MGKRKRKNKTKTKKAYVKSNVRLFSASDVVWMLQCDADRERKIVDAKIGLDGIKVKMEYGVDAYGDMTYATYGYDWVSVAYEMGFDVAEPVTDQFGNWYVLLYDKGNNKGE